MGNFIVISAYSISESSEAFDSLVFSSELLSGRAAPGKTTFFSILFCFMLTSLPTLPINCVIDCFFLPSGLKAAFFFFYSSLAAMFREEAAFKVTDTFGYTGDFIDDYFGDG